MLEAADGADALRQMAASAPNLVVLDLMMPVMDGWEVLRRIKRMLHPPVIVILSAFADCPRALAEGAADCLEKPFAPEKLLESCCRHLV